MNKQKKDILRILLKKPYVNQRVLAQLSGYSLGVVNRSMKELLKEGYIDQNNCLTNKSIKEIQYNKPKRAVILAAGFGMRMAPINTEIPKGLVEVKGEPLIERLIKQLHEVGIKDVYIVVGFMKEKYEYLIDEYQVELIVNPQYAKKNNLYSVKLVNKYLENCYIIPCDIWCAYNPFCAYEMYSWYMVSDFFDNESDIRVNRKMEIVREQKYSGGNAMLGICYLTKEDAQIVSERINYFSDDPRYDDSFWEEVLYVQNRMMVVARLVHSTDIVEINTYEQLRELDSNSNQLKTDAILTITRVLNVKTEEITNITVLKKGMTNRSFQFTCNGKTYIMRIPGEGTEQLINRRQEAIVYHKLRGKNICDNIIFINPENGYKITEFIEDARVCDPHNPEDVRRCMKMLKKFHDLKLKVNHEFDIFRQIEFYETLWGGVSSEYKDYLITKKNVFSLKKYIESHVTNRVLAHIDAVPDNFLFIKNKDKEEIFLIDWEYAGMQDPHVDVAMFCIYSLYDKKQIDELIDAYFTEGCDEVIRIKIYCYISACGLLWSNWCEYKHNLGVEFGEYSLKQYRYAKDYYRIAIDEIKKLEKRGKI